MELAERTIRIMRMVNAIVEPLIGKEKKLPSGGPVVASFQPLLDSVMKDLYPYSEIADDRIVDYLVYRLYVLRDSDHPTSLPVLFSQWGINGYRKQFMAEDGKSGMNYYIDRWLEEAGLSRQRLVKMIEKPKPNRMAKFIYMESDELIKRRFFNTEMGYLLCQQSTTGWTPRSELCSKCEFKKKCETATNRRLPELVRLRKQEMKNG